MTIDDSALFDRVFVVTTAACVRARAYATAPIVRAVHKGEQMDGHMVRGFSYKGENQWARVKLASGAIGYIWSGYGRWEEQKQ